MLGRKRTNTIHIISKAPPISGVKNEREATRTDQKVQRRTKNVTGAVRIQQEPYFID